LVSPKVKEETPMRTIEELLPDCNEFEEECKKFEQHEKCDAMYGKRGTATVLQNLWPDKGGD